MKSQATAVLLLFKVDSVVYLGVRQVGKSTLAKRVLKRFKESIFLDLQLPREIPLLMHIQKSTSEVTYFKSNEAPFV